MLSSDRPGPRICSPGLVRLLVRIFLTSIRLRTPCLFGWGCASFLVVLYGELGTHSRHNKGVYVIFWKFRQEYGML